MDREMLPSTLLLPSADLRRIWTNRLGRGMLRTGDAVLSRARRRDCRFQADSSGGQPQFHLLWWQALGRIFAEEGPDELVCQSGIVVGSHDHARLETQ